jgi:hypothetical protein
MKSIEKYPTGRDAAYLLTAAQADEIRELFSGWRTACIIMAPRFEPNAEHLAERLPIESKRPASGPEVAERQAERNDEARQLWADWSLMSDRQNKITMDEMDGRVPNIARQVLKVIVSQIENIHTRIAGLETHVRMSSGCRECHQNLI